MLADFAKMERPAVLHLGFQALHEYAQRKGGEMPAPGSQADAQEVVRLAQAMNEAGPKLEAAVMEKEEAVIAKLALGARGVLNPMAAFFGGIVGQVRGGCCWNLARRQRCGVGRGSTY